jgi:glycosyltransferase involved in cell wall biosynthesis
MKVPLVSCVMLTHDRPKLIVRALRYWAAQTYPLVELILVDTGKVSVAESLSENELHADFWRDFQGIAVRHPRVVRVVRAENVSIGKARNIGCELANGELIATFDDDDWYRDDRLVQQVGFWQVLRQEEGEPFDVVGATRALAYEPATRRACEFGLPNSLVGPSLLFTRATWKKVPFREVSRAEEIYFCQGRAVGCMGLVDWMIYMRHGGNVTTHDMENSFRQGTNEAKIARQWLGPDVAFYDGLG